MKQREDCATPRLAPVLFLAPALACAPQVDVAGVYFPGWLIASVSGVAASYLIVIGLGRRPGTRSLADSGLLFLSLAVGIALAVWWAGFSGF